MEQIVDRNKTMQMVKELTSFLLHKHYCENDVETVIKAFDDRLSWIGAGENEYATGAETVSGIFRKFAGVIPKCNIWDEECDVIEISPDTYLCSGRIWIATDPSVKMYLCVHQRITMVFRWIEDTFRCCHIHISNPYTEMSQQEIGFPTQMGKHSYEYLQKCIAEQTEQMEALRKMSFEDSMTGLFNRNKFNDTMQNLENDTLSQLGVACIDINGLKEVNDTMGHLAGDKMIRCVADHITGMFAGKGYRIGGDEFFVLDTALKEEDFKNAVCAVSENTMRDGIHVSTGVSWRNENCNINEQFAEADKRMYAAKAEFYKLSDKDRRKR